MHLEKKYIIAAAVGAAAGITVGLAARKNIERRGIHDSRRSKINKRVLILVNHEVVIYNFRLELVERLLAGGYEVHISTPAGARVQKLEALGAAIHDICFDRHGMNPINEGHLLAYYFKLAREVQPIIILGYTIKPNIYGAISSRVYHIPFVANITGLGSAVENGGMQSKVTLGLYRLAFGGRNGRIQRVFFQNESNEQFFKKAGIALDKHKILPGSGVNIDRFPFTEYPECGDGLIGWPVKFAFVSRIMKEKGIEQYLEAAAVIKTTFPNTEFHIAGFFEPEYDRGRLDELNDKGTVIYDGNVDDVAGYMEQMHCIVHPTYYSEGLSNVLLEASSCGRPVITTDRAGCREVVKGNGFLVPERSSKKLIEAIKRFISLGSQQKQDMGKAGRKLVEDAFNRKIIIEAYMDEVHSAESLNVI